ncbi:uncharacterized protein LOC110011560 [Sesamum indicum]|uniref:Uncharacterized protein LOC110011560 n=1 Tax=Sesamum indicum TaxID=4182 RepID=A0A8M8UTS7_SESIN|nr:uncharacterized protein LOC110011560 [Sesamum indicum]
MEGVRIASSMKQQLSELGCQLEPTTPMVVSVADVRQMVSQLYCPTFTWEIQGKLFSYPMRTLTLGGCHMVLGGDWLGQYSLVAYAYNSMTVRVSQMGRSGSCKPLGNSQNYTAYLLKACPSLLMREHTDSWVNYIQYLLLEPQGLPPRRDIEHHRTLLHDGR